MGVDTCIYFKTRDGEYPMLCDMLPYGAAIEKAGDCAVDDATHEVDQGWRYYAPGYERGPWPSIAAVLMALMASENVETVWYFGDCHDEAPPLTPEIVAEYCKHYMTHGDRPYRGKFERPAEPSGAQRPG